MYRRFFYLFFLTAVLCTTFSAFSSESGSYSGKIKTFSFSQQKRAVTFPVNFTTENSSKKKIKFNGKMKAGLVIGIIGAVTLNNALSAGISSSVLWGWFYFIGKNSINTPNVNGLAFFFVNGSLMIAAIATAAYAAFNFLLGLVLTIVGFSLLSRGHDEVKKLSLELSYENRPALAFAIKL